MFEQSWRVASVLPGTLCVLEIQLKRWTEVQVSQQILRVEETELESKHIIKVQRGSETYQRKRSFLRNYLEEIPLLHEGHNT